MIEKLEAEVAEFQEQLRDGVTKDGEKYRDLEKQKINLERQLQQREFDLEKLKNDLQEKESDIGILTETFEREYEALRLENERNVQELHRVFRENIERNRPVSFGKTHMQDDTMAGAESDMAYAPLQPNQMKPPMAPSSRQQHLKS